MHGHILSFINRQSVVVALVIAAVVAMIFVDIISVLLTIEGTPSQNCLLTTIIMV